jgi:hypothetical protein
MDAFSTELGIRLTFVKTSEISRGEGGGLNPQAPLDMILLYTKFEDPQSLVTMPLPSHTVTRSVRQHVDCSTLLNWLDC